MEGLKSAPSVPHDKTHRTKPIINDLFILSVPLIVFAASLLGAVRLAVEQVLCSSAIVNLQAKQIKLFILRQLLRRCREPVYSHLCCKSYDRETAKDLTQGFFHEIVLGRSLIQQADRSKGRFRTFLLTALDRYVISVQRTEKRKKRMPEGGIISLDDVEWLAIPDRDGTPTQVFDHAWASAVLDQALSAVEQNYRGKGKATHWDVFRARVLAPIMENAECPPLPDLCEKYGISDTAKASKMIIRVKRRFRTLLRRHVRQLVNSDAEVDEEIRYLMKVFSTGPGATELCRLFSLSAKRTTNSA